MKSLHAYIVAAALILGGLAGLQAADGDLVYRAINKGTITKAQAAAYFSQFVTDNGSEPVASSVALHIRACTVDGAARYCYKIVAEESDTSAAVKALLLQAASDPDYDVMVTGRVNE